MTGEEWRRFANVGGLRQFDPNYKSHTGPDTDKESTGPVEAPVRRKCAIHDKDENVVPWTAYIQCPECWHVYLTEEEFVVAYNEVRRQANIEFKRAHMNTRADMATTGEDVAYCGLCLHDI